MTTARWAGTLRRFVWTEEGQDLLEYGLLAALIAVVAVAAITLVGQQLDVVFWQTIAAAI